MIAAWDASLSPSGGRRPVAHQEEKGTGLRATPIASGKNVADRLPPYLLGGRYACLLGAVGRRPTAPHDLDRTARLGAARSAEDPQGAVEDERRTEPEREPHPKPGHGSSTTMAALEDHGGPLARDDDDADGHRDERRGDADVDDDSVSVGDVADGGLADRGHGEEGEHQPLRPAEPEQTRHRERGGRPDDG